MLQKGTRSVCAKRLNVSKTRTAGPWVVGSWASLSSACRRSICALRDSVSAGLMTLLFIVLMLCSLATPTSPLFAKEGIEIVPIAVWLGQFERASEADSLREIRAAFPGLRMAHAVDAAYIVRSEESRQRFQVEFSQGADPSDDVLMHMAPWKSITGVAGVPFKFEPTAFGSSISDMECAIDCGLDLSFRAFTPLEAKAVMTSAKKALFYSGFGDPKAVYFDEGIVDSKTRAAAFQSGLDQDWSGVELTQFKDIMGRLPVFIQNEQNLQDHPWQNLHEVASNGLVLDGVRFGIQSEIGDLDGAVTLIKKSLETAKQQARVVRVPIIFNVEDLMHTKNFVKAALTAANKMAAEAGVSVVEWQVLNSSWDIKKIGSFVAAQALVNQPFASPKSDEAEFVPANEQRVLDIESH